MAQPGLKLGIPLPRLPKCWDYWNMQTELHTSTYWKNIQNLYAFTRAFQVYIYCRLLSHKRVHFFLFQNNLFQNSPIPPSIMPTWIPYFNMNLHPKFSSTELLKQYPKYTWDPDMPSPGLIPLRCNYNLEFSIHFLCKFFTL